MMKYFFLLAFFSLTSKASVTVSGISSGAYMAQQYHVAFSSEVSGAGLIAGGPYYCARGKIVDALNRCMQVRLGLPTVANSLRASEDASRKGQIDPLHHLANSKVYILAGTEDKTVDPQIAQVLIESYRAWKLLPENILTETRLQVGHAFPTLGYGNRCAAASEAPYIANCGRDIAGEMLEHLLGPLAPRTAARPGRVFSFPQLDGVSADLDRMSLHSTGYAYVPEGCEVPETSGCRIHVAFHGCKQTVDDLENIFITKTGYNEWAESNRLVIVYPQAQKNLFVNNPNGCWDWWGYTKSNYHLKDGPQMKRIYALVESIRLGKMTLSLASFKK